MDITSDQLRIYLLTVLQNIDIHTANTVSRTGSGKCGRVPSYFQDLKFFEKKMFFELYTMAQVSYAFLPDRRRMLSTYIRHLSCCRNVWTHDRKVKNNSRDILINIRLTVLGSFYSSSYGQARSDTSDQLKLAMMEIWRGGFWMIAWLRGVNFFFKFTHFNSLYNDVGLLRFTCRNELI